MSDQEQTPAPEEATTEVTETPETPEVKGQEEDKATTEKDQREELYQTKYQEEKITNKGLMEKLAQYESSEQPAQPAQAKPDEPAPTEPKELEPYTPEWQAKHDEELVAKMVKATSAQNQQTAQTQEWNKATKDFKAWTVEHKIPDAMVTEASQAFQQRFTGASASATIEWISNYIVEASGKMRKSQATDDLAKDAADKASKLKSVESPKPGTATKPEPAEKKTQEDIALGKFGGTTHKASDVLFEESK